MWKLFINLILISFFIIYCSAHRPYWISENPQIQVNLYNKQARINFYIEPDSEITALQEIIKELFNFLENIQTFPYFNKIPDFKIILYKDSNSYKKFKNFNLDSLAHFDRKNKEIHLSLKNITETNTKWAFQQNPNLIYYNSLIIKHEMIHAIIEECCNSLPVWFNEGIALLLQNLNQKFECKKTEISILSSLVSYKIFLIKQNIHLPFFPNFEDIYNDVLIKNVISGLYVYFLWENQELLKILDLYMNDIHFSLYEYKTSGDKNHYNNLKKEFYIWISRLNSNKKVSGC